MSRASKRPFSPSPTLSRSLWKRCPKSAQTFDQSSHRRAPLLYSALSPCLLFSFRLVRMASKRRTDDSVTKLVKKAKASYGDVIFADHLAKFEQKPAVFESEKEIKEEVVVEDEVSEDLSNPVVSYLQQTLQTGDIQKVGTIIRNAVLNRQLSENQLKMIARSAEKPEISMTSVVMDLEMSDLRGVKDFMIGQSFINTMPSAPQLQKSSEAPQYFENSVEPSAQSTSTNFGPTSQKMEKLYHLPLLGKHIIPEYHPFPTMNLNVFYEKHTLIGDSASTQLSDIMRKIFASLLSPTHEIWLFSYRYNTTRQTDRHFRALPKEVVEVLIDFGIDVFGGYLPEHLLYNSEFDPNDDFIRRLNSSDPEEEIERRRSARTLMKQVVQHAISESLRQLRTYHYDPSTGSLVTCQQRKQCSIHLHWEMVRKTREHLRSIGKNEDLWTEEDLNTTA